MHNHYSHAFIISYFPNITTKNINPSFLEFCMDKEILESYRKAGKITSQVREFGKELIKPGVKVIDVLDKIEEKIKSLGGGIGFPAQISLNEIAAHFCPEEEDEITFQKGDVAKLDIGVHINGYVGDSAVTIDLGNNKDLCNASKEALKAAIEITKTGIELGKIGKIIGETIRNHGFEPVKNLSGHGVDHYSVHCSPQIPNFDTGDKTTLEKDQFIAIEPFASTGAGMIHEQGKATVFMLSGKRPVRSLITRQVMKTILQYDGLPFTTRWLTREFGVPKVNFALRELENIGILRSFPPLPDKNDGIVSQHEHTIRVDDEAEILTK